MRLRDGMSHSEIAKRTGLSRNTVKKWLKEPQAQAPQYRRRHTPGKLSTYVAELEQALMADARRPKAQRRTARALYAQIKGQGYAGGYTVVSDFVRAWRHSAGDTTSGTTGGRPGTGHSAPRARRNGPRPPVRGGS